MTERKYARIQTALPGPQSAAVLERKRQFVAAPLETYAPFVVRTSEGAILEDLDGNRFIDFTGGWGCLAVGQRNRRVVDALADQLEGFLHTDFTAVPYAPLVDLAEALSRRTPLRSPAKAAFFNSGAEAIENAVKIARAATRRKAILVFENAFHGRTLLAMTMTHKARPYKTGFGPFASDVYRLPYPYEYRKSLSAAEIETALLSLVDPSEVAAMVVEPVIGEGGFLVPPPWFLPSLRDLADRYGFALVFDEVQSGVGRTGTFYAYEQLGAQPDLVCVAKSLASGLPLSAVVGRAELMDAPIASAIGGTYAGNPLACRAALEVLRALDEDGLLERARHVGARIRAGFESLAGRYPVIGDVRGLGAMVAI
ncbi:MAG: aspartate aminotransferase family protein, partial [Candidatus Bipolaricaulota bacterium]